MISTMTRQFVLTVLRFAVKENPLLPPLLILVALHLKGLHIPGSAGYSTGHCLQHVKTAHRVNNPPPPALCETIYRHSKLRVL